MKRINQRALVVVVAAALGLGVSVSSARQAPRMDGEYGAGIQSNVLNFGLGPVCEYWVTDDIGIGGSLGLSGSFQSIGVRGLWLFDKAIPIGQNFIVFPYAGGGVVRVTESSGGIDLEGTGVEAFVGAQKTRLFNNPNIVGGLEFVLSQVDLEDTICGSLGCVRVSSDYSSFSFGAKIMYFFGDGIQ